MTEINIEENSKHTIPERLYTGLFIEEEFTLESGEKVGFAESDWLIEMGVPVDIIAEAEERQVWRTVRNERDRLLSETDWTQNKDVPDEISTLWADYRQALRDITNQENPDDVVWPEAPT